MGLGRKRRASGARFPEMKASQPVSRVLSRMTIHLGHMSPCASSDLPGDRADHTRPCGPSPYLVLLRAGFTLPPLLPGARCALTAPFHPCLFRKEHRRSVLCGTFRGLAPPRRYLAPCPMEPGLSSTSGTRGDHPADSGLRIPCVREVPHPNEEGLLYVDSIANISPGDARARPVSPHDTSLPTSIRRNSRIICVLSKFSSGRAKHSGQ